MRSSEEAREWLFWGRGGGVGGSSAFFIASSNDVLEYDLEDKQTKQTCPEVNAGRQNTCDNGAGSFSPGSSVRPRVWAQVVRRLCEEGYSVNKNL